MRLSDNLFIYLFIYFIKIFCIKKNTQGVFKYLNPLKNHEHNKTHKQISFRFYT